jgi:tetratricopeptide (TPR) repeat protein
VEPPELRQEASAADRAQQPVLGSGTQHNYFATQQTEEEAAVSIAPPLGQRDEAMPLRGRDDLLAELTGARGQVHVLHGLGGCGKTRLALEAAYLAQVSSTDVWWIPATESGELVAGMRSLGRRLGLTDAELAHGDAADRIWQRLLTWPEPWLLVLDNADDPQILAGAGRRVTDGRGWLRPVTSAAGAVLVTSRDGTEVSWGRQCRRHRLAVLGADDATSVLLDYARHLPAVGSDDDAADLADRLGGLPLALKITGSYLYESASVPLAFADPGVIRTYRQYREALDGGTFPTPSAELTQDQARELIGRTWDLTLDLLDARQVPEARLLLRLLAAFADAPIPYELLLHPETMAASPLFEAITGPRLWQVLQSLDGFGLIDLEVGGDLPVARLHPLVRDASQVADEKSPAYVALAAGLLERATSAAETGRPEDPQVWALWQLLVPHATYVFDSVTAAPGSADAVAVATATAAYYAARYQTARGLHVQAEAILRRVLAVREEALGAEHPDTLSSRHELARAMAERGDHVEAEAEFREVLAAELRVLGPDHPTTLATRHEVAWAMAERGDHAGAEAEYREVLAAELRVLGPDHPTTLATRHEVARMMAERGDHAGAEAEYREVLAAGLRVLGLDHPDTLITRYEVARMMAERGDHVSAEAELREVLAVETRVLGPDHPSTRMTAMRVDYYDRREGGTRT